MLKVSLMMGGLPWRHSCVVWALVLALGLVLVPPTFVRGAGIRELNEKLEATLKRELPSSVSVSLQVVGLDNGQVLMEKNPDLPLVPA